MDHLSSCTEEELLKDEESLKSNFILILNTANKFDHVTKLPRLSQFCKDVFQQDPSLIFKADDFVTINQELLLEVLTKNDYSLDPIGIWNKLIEWAIAQDERLSPDYIKWNDDNKSIFGTLIKTFIPHIDFKNITYTVFTQKIAPFKSIFDREDYIEILEYYLSDDAKYKISIDSRIINPELAVLLCNFIKLMNKGARNNFYKFELLIRGSRDGFESSSFEKHCEEKGPTITVARVKNTSEILGGYNNLKWKSYWSNICTEGNFIFSLDTNDPRKSNYSKVENKNTACRNIDVVAFAPDFGDLWFLVNSTNKGGYRKKSYEKLIRKSEGTFDIDDYEVFQVIQVNEQLIY